MSWNLRRFASLAATGRKATACAALLYAATADGALVYVDAASGVGGNTTLADGSVFTPPLNGTTGADNNWEQRTVFGSSGNIFESGGENVTEDAPEIRTTITGLTPGNLYEVYANFWDPTSTTEDWSLRAGLASNPGANTLFSAADATVELSSTAAILASTQTFTTAPTIFLESSRALLAASLGVIAANASGEIAVYVDDLPTSLNVNRRTWYDGVSYGPAPVPEPSSVLLIGLAFGAAIAARRKSIG